tara:strand:- start:258 stop:656 length:399 start_codon:yes stop_codon:yes gene_type:complete
MAITRNSFTGLQVSELEGVDVTYFTVDYINAMDSEIGDPLANSDVSGLALVQQAIMNQGINILGMGPLGNTNTEQTFMVRTDSLDTANHITGNGIRDAIRAVDAERAASRSPSATANLATATVTVKTLTIAV